MFTDKELEAMGVTDETAETEGSVVVEGEVEEKTYTPTSAPLPKAEIEATVQDWFKTICDAEDLPDYMRDIPAFHYKALSAKLETVLMKAGVFAWDDGRLANNKKKGVKIGSAVKK